FGASSKLASCESLGPITPSPFQSSGLPARLFPSMRTYDGPPGVGTGVPSQKRAAGEVPRTPLMVFAPEGAYQLGRYVVGTPRPPDSDRLLSARDGSSWRDRSMVGLPEGSSRPCTWKR